MRKTGKSNAKVKRYLQILKAIHFIELEECQEQASIL